MSRSSDVVVVGAGPAGATAARQLAASGRRVVLLDRSPFPRAKVCGDGLTPRAIAMLERLEVWPRIRASATLVRRLETRDLLTGDHRTGPLPSRVDDGPAHGAVVSRTLLDDALRRAAMSAGAAFVAEAHVRRVTPARRGGGVQVWVTTGRDERVYEADVVIAADGASSRVAESTFGSRPGVLRGVAIRQYWKVPTTDAFVICMPLRDRAGDVAGYGWVFPVTVDVANVGVGVLSGRRESVREIYRRFVNRLRAMSQSWRQAVPIGPVEGGALAAGLRRDRVATDGLLFVGDAAGAVNAFSGEGIAQALTSGFVAADAIVSVQDVGRKLADRYWDGLVTCFPESTRNVGWLPWVVDRGRVFAREFWHAASTSPRAMSRAARRVSIDERATAPVIDRGATGTGIWTALTRRIADRRPLLAQLLDALESEAAPLAERSVAAFRAAADPSDPPPPDIDLALASIAGVLLLASDPDERPVRDDPVAVDAVAEWATDAMTLGAADLLMAELFQILVSVPARWSVAVGSAASVVVARAASPASRRDVHALFDDVVDVGRTAAATLDGVRDGATGVL